MKLRAKHRSEVVPYVRLYLDDIERILEVLKVHCNSVSVEGDGFELDDPFNINEYKQLSIKQFESISIRGREPSVYVEPQQFYFLTSGLKIYVSQDDINSLGVMQKLVDVIKPRSRRFVTFYNSSTGYGVSLLVIVALVLIIARKLELSESFVYLSLGAWLAIRVLSTELPFFKTAVTFRKTFSHEESNFFSRNKDKLIIAVVSGVGGFFLALLAEAAKKFLAGQ